MKNLLTMSLLLLFIHGHVHAEMSEASQVSALQYEWERVNYELDGDEQAKAFEDLAQISSAAVEEFPDSAEVLIWNGIVKSTYAGIKGGMSALKLAKQAKASFESAIAINGNALTGSAYTSLGILYAKVPGWPIGFGSNK